MSESPHSKVLETATLGGGCFWCLEAAFNEIVGVEKVVSGYAGGAVPNPTYGAVCSGRTGHAEVVQITFDTSLLKYGDILDIFWAIHNPTTLNRQGNDVGTQYRSIILTSGPEQDTIAQNSRDTVRKLWEEPVVTEIVSLDTFYPAEVEHQNYFANNPQAAYCQIVINPKLKHLREQFAARIRPNL